MPRLPFTVLAVASLAACSTTTRNVTVEPPTATSKPGRLALPASKEPAFTRLSPGVHKLASESGDAYFYVPTERAGPRPLLVVFHGAGGQARQMIDLLSGEAEAQGLLLLAPQSSGHTWDLITGEYGADAAMVQQLLSAVPMLAQVDPARVGVGGFSDGASYALSLGLDNGDLFSSVLAFSPGFTAQQHRVGSPRVFVSHGTADQVLNVDSCGRAVVARLREMGYGVTYREFEGPHTVPREIAGAAALWFAGGS